MGYTTAKAYAEMQVFRIKEPMPTTPEFVAALVESIKALEYWATGSFDCPPGHDLEFICAAWQDEDPKTFATYQKACAIAARAGVTL
jgi:hypothetical protein